MGANKNNLTLEEQRDNVQDAIKRALSRNDRAEVLWLEENLEWLEEEIKKANTK